MDHQPMQIVTSREYALKLYDQALNVYATDRVMSYRCLVSAVQHDAHLADAWLMLGNILAEDKNYDAAVAAFRAGLSCRRGDERGDLTVLLHHKMMVNLGQWLMNRGDLVEAEAVIAKTVRLFIGSEPNSIPFAGGALAYINLSVLYSKRCEFQGSVAAARSAIALLDEPVSHMALAFAMMFSGEYADGFREFEARFPYKLPGYLNLPYPRWRAETDVDKVLLVMCEQGLGDSLCFARFIPEAAGRVRKLIFQVQPELVGLFEGAFPSNVEVVPQSAFLPEADVWCPVFSLPVTLCLDNDEIVHCPGLRSLNAASVNLDNFDPDNTNVAIAYGGSPSNDIDVHRSIPPAEFLALLQVPGVVLWSVQVGPRVQEMHNVGMAGLVRDCSPWIRDARDTAGILNQMDLVVCCESFVGHLAGALNIETWVLCSKLGLDWRTGAAGDGTLWYEKTRLFRQGEDRRWGPVFQRMINALDGVKNA